MSFAELVASGNALGLAGSGQARRGTDDLLFQDNRFPLLLLTAYPKSVKEDLTAAEYNAIARLVAAIKAERRG